MAFWVRRQKNRPNERGLLGFTVVKNPLNARNLEKNNINSAAFYYNICNYVCYAQREENIY